MIAYLKGLVLEIGESWVVLDVQNVGYQVFCSQKTLQNFTIKDQQCALHIETVVREDLIQLYGFGSPSEKEAFQVLRTVQGVGMKMALSILSTLTSEELAHAIVHQDKTKLVLAEGVGPKVASRIISELKDKVSRLGDPLSINNVIPINKQSNQNRLIDDAVSVLVNLGYKRLEALDAAQKAFYDFGSDIPEMDQVIRKSLQTLAR